MVIFLGFFGEKTVYLFDSHSKDDEGNISQNGTAALIKFETLDGLEDCIKLIYYSSQHQKNTLFSHAIHQY